MELKSTIVIVSVFGRGQWLAVDLVKKGLNVTLLDLSSKLGHWSPEDWEGPFGFFKSEKLTPLQLERLQADEHPVALNNGFTLWLNDGPLEFKTGLTKHRLSKLSVPELVQDYLMSYDSYSHDQKKQIQKKILSDNFENSWLAHFLHQISSSTYSINPLSIESARPLPVFQQYYIRHASRPGYERSLRWAQDNGVQVIDKVDILDLSFLNRNTLGGLEVKSEEASGLMRFDQLVWMLTGEESLMLGERIFKHIYKKLVEPEWAWVRYRFDFQKSTQRDELPNHVVLVDNIYLPWTHENCCILQKTLSEDHVDIWIRIPNSQRFNKQYLVDKSVRIKDFLCRKIPNTQITVFEYPQEYHYTYQQLGASRNPVFSDKHASINSLKEFQNVHYFSPETTSVLGWEGVWGNQNLLSEKIINWWNALQLKLAKKNGVE